MLGPRIRLTFLSPFITIQREIGSWFSGKESINTVVIGDEVKTIGDYAFRECTGLTSVTIPNSVTSIGNSAFSGCSGLTSITIPNSVTSIGESAFSHCTGLTSVTIPNSVTTIGSYAFSGCSGLTSVTIPNSVTSIGDWAFSGCSGLTSVTIGNSVKAIGRSAFYECTGLTSITIPNSVTSIGEYAFSSCYFHVSSFINNSTLTDTNNWGAILFDEEKEDGLLIKDNVIVGCRLWATSVTIPNSVTSIGESAFSHCTGLTSVTIPNSVTTIGSSAFSGCSGLTSVTISNSVTSIGSSAFSGCSGLTSVTIPNSVTSIGYRTFYGCSGLASVSIPNSVTSIGDLAFSDCSGLTSVTIPGSVTSIGNWAFSDCSGLSSITIPNSVTSIGRSAFYGSGWYNDQPDGILYLDNWLIGVKGEPMGKLVISEGTRGLAGSAFSGCSGLTSVTIPNSVTSIGSEAFNNCSGLTSVTIPNSVTSIGYRTFYGCSGLTSVTIPGSVTSIGSSAFSGCSGLTSVIIPNSVMSIEWYAFSGCSGLTSVTIGNSVTSIGDYAFYGCSGLTSVTIPNSVTSIGYGTFSGCNGLTSVTSLIEEPFSISSVFDNSTYDNAILYVSTGTIDAYQSTDGWKRFKNIEEKEFGSTLFLVVTDDKGTNLADKVSITWYDADGKAIGTGASLSGIEEGTVLYYSVTLDDELGRVYREVTMQKVVAQESEPLTCQLEKIGELTLHGTVASEGNAIAGADVNLTQWLNGKYEYTASTKTDDRGEFTLKAYADSTLLTFSAKGFVDKEIERSMIYSAELGTIELEQAKGMTVALQLSYQEAVREGQEPIVQDWYSDTRNITYKVRNVTKNEDITDFAMQQGDIVLPIGTEVADRIRVTLTSMNGKFAEASGEGIVGDDGTATVAIRLVAFGGVEVTVGQKSDDQLLLMLYDDSGKLAGSTTLAGSRVTFSGFEAGGYTLVAMGYNGTVGSIGDISDLDGFGLVQGIDYVSASVNIRDGIIGSVAISDVPELDASKFEYTSLNTSYLPNKTQMTLAGPLSYVTLTARVDFKTQYANEVSGVKVVVDIPDGCEFIANSVVTGTKALPHTLNGNQLTITLGQEDIDSRIRFCMMPKQTGMFTSTANAEFDCRGEKRQSIGTAVFEATAGSISVPSMTASKTVTVNGIAASHATVDVYDDDQLIGTTTALGDGKWRANVELYKPYNLSTHGLYAKYETADGIKATTETQECFYDMNQVRAKSVTMSFYNGWLKKNIEVVFDFETGKASSNDYMFYTATDFTFVADLTANDTTTVNGVNFYVRTTKKEERKLKGFFDKTLGRWVAVSKFDSYNLPVNLGIEVMARLDGKFVMIDRQYIDDELTLMTETLEQRKEDVVQADSLLTFVEVPSENEDIYRELTSMLSQPDYDEDKVEKLLDIVLSNIPDTGIEVSPNISDDMMKEHNEEENEAYNLWLQKQTSEIKDSLLSSLFMDRNILEASLPEFPLSFNREGDESDCTYNIELVSSIDEEKLVEQGYITMNMSDGSKVYCNFSDVSVSFIDEKSLTKYQIEYSNSAFSRAEIKREPVPGSSITQMIRGVRSDFLSFKPVLGNIANNSMRINTLLSTIAQIYSITHNNIRETISGAITREIDNCNDMLDITKGQIEMRRHLLKGKKAVSFEEIKDLWTAEAHRATLNQRIASLTRARRLGTEALDILPVELNRTIRLNNAMRTLGRVTGGLSILIDLIDLYIKISDYGEEINGWDSLKAAVDKKIPCEGDNEKAIAIQEGVVRDFHDMERDYTNIISLSLVTTVIDAAQLFTPNVYANYAEYMASLIVGTWTECYRLFTVEYGKYVTRIVKHWMDLQQLKCKKSDKEKEDDAPQDNVPGNYQTEDDAPQDNVPGNYHTGSAANIYLDPSISDILNSNQDSQSDDLIPRHDPSGFVYEAVPTNRVEGVTATIYFDQSKPTQWDAADFSQVNPQVTDETGLYQWDVPQGMWQVRFEKSGYETTQTDWLPVPPPQMEINIPMMEAVAPTVVNVRGTESGITLDFSKYMKPATLEGRQVSATVNGNDVSGDVVMLNLEEDPYNQKEYASKVKFVPQTAFKTSDEVVITVKKEVESYADKQMAQDFVATVKIESEIEGLKCDSLIAVDYQGDYVLEIAATPAAAVKGRTLSVATTSAMIAAVDRQSVTFDDEGKAQITVSGNLPGSASLHLQMDGTDIEKYVDVNVVLHETVVKAPKASKRSGSTIEAGYLLWLTCNTPGATIYYTLDGSCPCDAESRIKYTGPFALPVGQVTVSAVAVRQGMEDSDVATYVYTVEGGEVGIADAKADLHIDAEYADGVLTISGAEGCTVRVFDLLGRELVSRRSAGKSVSMQIPKAESYVVSVTTRDGQTVVRKVTGK